MNRYLVTYTYQGKVFNTVKKDHTTVGAKEQVENTYCSVIDIEQLS